METTHTPTPWQYDNDNGRIYDNQAGELVAMTECLDDAAFIVRAVNAHEELLSALKRVTSQYEAFVTQAGLEKDSFHKRLDKDARQAIATAEGK